MAKRLVLNRWEDYFSPGNVSDSQLFHADASDRILVCPPWFGEGYIQEIPLEDSFNLVIHDFTLNQDVVIDTRGKSKHLKFEFQIISIDSRYSYFSPSFGLKYFEITPAQQRFFEIEIVFRESTLIKYFQAFIERLSPQLHGDVANVLQAIYRHRGGGSTLTTTGFLNQIYKGESRSDADEILEYLLTNDSYSAAVSLMKAARHLITAAMEQVIGQILSCPYQGAVRRAYLKGKALELVSLYFETMVRPHISNIDLHCIYEAAAILRKQFVNPPTVQTLARQVSTNRLYLNQGFHQVFGTTPYGYLRDYRLWHARRLLITSDLSISSVATAVGYTCRSHFATAFRQRMGINPKPFQIGAWQYAS
ncbi:MAG: AraC family transcriptional regulator [Cyanobacteria bacterium P01_D01_bin.156]